MIGKAFISALVVAMLIAPHAAAARSETMTYEIAFQNLSGSQADAAGVTTDGSIDYGGVRFTPLVGETAVTINVADALGGSPFVTVCQDANVNTICGEPGEPRISGCGELTVSIAPTGGDVIVFVSVQSAAAPSIGQQSVTPLPCGDNVSLASTGTVTATFS